VLLVRSIVFNVLFYLNLTLLCLMALPTLAMPRGAIVAIARLWGRTTLLLLRLVCNIKVEYSGLEKIPPGPCIVAAKHQSAWETFVLLLLVDKPAYIMKRELMWLPLFGWYAWKASMIPIDRDAGGQVIPRLTRRVRKALRDGFQILIFPEGTRRPAGAPPLIADVRGHEG
jgi:1-acyl-sn-glycerol-3-phosphate acyltransferase